MIKKIKDYMDDIKKKSGKKTNNELVKVLGVGKGYVSDLINEVKPIGPSKCILLAEELKINPEILLVTMLWEKEKDLEVKAKMRLIIKRMKKEL